MQNVLRILDTESLSQPKILLIEDNKFDRVFLKRIIESYYPYTLIDNAELKSEACQLLEKNTYDVIFLDLMLPDTVGIEDVEEVKKLANGAPIIVVTGSYDEHILKKIRSYGINGLIGKSELAVKDFSTAISEAIEKISNN